MEEWIYNKKMQSSTLEEIISENLNELYSLDNLDIDEVLSKSIIIMDKFGIIEIFLDDLESDAKSELLSTVNIEARKILLKYIIKTV